jgi:hypothetical protein
MSGLEIAVAIIGVGDVAVRSILSFIDYLQQLHDAPEEVQKARHEIEAVVKNANGLDFLQNDSQPVKDKVLEIGLKEVVEDCGTACAELEKDLKERTKKGGVSGLVSKMKVTRHKAKFGTYTARIASTRSTVILAVTTAGLCVKESPMPRDIVPEC